jgi:hypothetical protein
MERFWNAAVATGGGELERQRQVVQPAAQLDNRLVRLDARPRAEELDRPSGGPTAGCATRTRYSTRSGSTTMR